jgi:hypothetical protein
MTPDLIRLITEYRAIEETDLLHKQTRGNENVAIGLTVRTVRRQEILYELLDWIRNAEDALKNDQN